VETVSDFVMQRLRAWGVERIFGYPGDGINGLLAALQRAGNQPTFIQARHEETAAFMASGQARFGKQPGVCLATSGPGAIHLLNGLYDAKLDRQPIVAIVGQSKQAAMGGHYQQEVDLAALFKDVAHEYVQTLTEPAQARHVVDVAFRTALAERAVTCIIIPSDVQEQEAVRQPPHEHGTVHSGVGFSWPVVVPAADDLRAAADVLNAGERVAILVGAGARQAGTEVLEVADRLGAGIATAMLGWNVVPQDLPFVTGPIGLIGAVPSWDLMTRCDTLLMIGSSFPYSEFLPKEGQARGVQIDIDPRLLNLRYPMEVALAGDSATTLRALLPLLGAKADRAWRASVEESVRTWRATVDEHANRPTRVLNPHQAFRALSAQLPADAMLAGDSGTVVSWLAHNVVFQPTMDWSVSGSLATMGSAVPYAIAAKFAHPDRPVVALAGDGAMQMSGNAELVTVAHYWRSWRDPRFIIVVVNNGDLGFVTWEQRLLMGNPRFDVSQTLPTFPYADYADLIGLAGRRVDRPADLSEALAWAFQADRPVLLELVIDPDIPPMPLSHLTPKQEQMLTAARAKGDSGILTDSPADFAATIAPYLPPSG
jgi:pyruvate dehydrogenase (quinone)